MSTSIRLDLQTLGSQPVMPKNLPYHWGEHAHIMIGRTGSYLQMNWLSLRNNRLKLKTIRKLLIIQEEMIEYLPTNKGKPEDVNM